MTATDQVVNAHCSRTATLCTKLMGLRGLSGSVVWDVNTQQYVANGTPCGCSVHGVYEWMDKQKGVKP